MKKYLALMLVAFIIWGGCSYDGMNNDDIKADVLSVGATEVYGTSISTSEAEKLIAANSGNEDFILLDVRTPVEFAAEHLAGAENIDYEDSGFLSEIGKLDKSKTYLLYCRSGRRSGEAMDIMIKQGFNKIYDIKGGINEWKIANKYVTSSR